MNLKKNLEVRFVNNNIGYGVFTNEKIKKGEIVEVCYIVEIGRGNNIGKFIDYVFEHPVSKNFFVPFGYGAIYNHSDLENYECNMFWKLSDNNPKFMEFISLRDIEVNEELKHSYGYVYWQTRSINKII